MRKIGEQEQGKTKRSHRWSPGNQAEATGRGEVSERVREGMIRK